MSVATVPLGELCDILSGFAWSASKFNHDGRGVPIIRIQNVDAVSDNNFVFWDEFYEERFVIRKGDLLLTLSGSFRIEAWPGKDALLNQRIIKLMPSPKLDRGWLLHVLRSRLGQIERLGKHALVNNVSLGDIRNLAIPLPPLEEQRLIAEVLDRAEELRTKRRAALTQLDVLTQAIFLDLFGDPATNPKGWRRNALCEITSKITDGEHLNPVFSAAGMPMVMAGNVLDDLVDLRTAKMVDSTLGERFRKKCNPEKGDLLLVSRGATIGRLCSIDFTDRVCLMGSVILIKPDSGLLDNKYLSALLKHPLMWEKLYAASGSSAQQAIYIKDIKRLSCPVPPLPLQREFAYRVTAIEKLKAAHRASLAEMDALFASLQHRAFRGEL